MKKIAVTTTSFAKGDARPIDMLHKGGFEAVLNESGRKLSREETLALCIGCVGIVAGTESYDRGLLVKLAGLRAISRCGVGMENIDLAAAGELGIEVVNTPSGPTLAVAELTVALMLNLLRKVSEMDKDIRSGRWTKKMGNLLSGKRVGIIGFGRIGQKVSELLRPFECEINYTDIAGKDKIDGFRQLPLGRLLKDSDIISVHISSGDELIGAQELKQMKRGALLINMSRGGVVDEDAIFRALKSGYLGGAALDVFRLEPYNGPLKELENIILTPHIGSYASETRVGMEIEAVKNLLEKLKGAI